MSTGLRVDESRIRSWLLRLLVAGAASSFVACGSSEGSEQTGHSGAFCDHYKQYEDKGWGDPPKTGFPVDPVRGQRIGRVRNDCDDDPNGKLWLRVYAIRGLSQDEGIWVEHYGPMAPSTAYPITPEPS